MSDVRAEPFPQASLQRCVNSAGVNHPAGTWAFGQLNTIYISWFPDRALVWWIWFEHTDEIKQGLQW